MIRVTFGESFESHNYEFCDPDFISQMHSRNNQKKKKGIKKGDESWEMFVDCIWFIPIELLLYMSKSHAWILPNEEADMLQNAGFEKHFDLGDSAFDRSYPYKLDGAINRILFNRIKAANIIISEGGEIPNSVMTAMQKAWNTWKSCLADTDTKIDNMVKAEGISLIDVDGDQYERKLFNKN